MAKTPKSPVRSRKAFSKKLVLPAIALGIYALALALFSTLKPAWFVDLGLWIYLPLLPIEIWLIKAYQEV